jgi:hypothetical protein
MKLKWSAKTLYSERITEKYVYGSDTSPKQSAKTSNVRNIPSNRFLFRLVPSARRIAGTEYSLLPTVQTQGLKVCNPNGKTEFMNPELLPTPTNSMETYQDFVQAKFHSSKRPEYGKILLPTPSAMMPSDTDMKKRDLRMEKLKAKGLSPATDSLSILAKKGLLPTPQSRDHKGKCHETQKCLPNTFQTGGTSQLNPLFVGEMMGFPTDWLTSPFLAGDGKASKPSETPSSRK